MQKYHPSPRHTWSLQPLIEKNELVSKCLSMREDSAHASVKEKRI